MSKAPLSIMDPKREPEDMKYLIQPHGPARGWVFRMMTPLELVGKPNPWNGKSFGKEIKKGLGTRRLVDARKLRDIALGQIRQLVHELSDEGLFSLASAREWVEQIKEDDAQQSDRDTQGGVSMVLSERLHEAERRGVSTSRLKSFARVAFSEGFPLDHAVTQYVEERGPNNSRGYKPLATTTILNLDTAIMHLRNFLEDTDKTACLEDLTADQALRFRDDFLPSVKTQRAPNGLSSGTTEKNVTLLRSLWVWACERRLVTKGYKNPWKFARSIPRTRNSGKPKRGHFTPDEMTLLLKATVRGTREGDALRLALVTGLRADEVAMIRSEDVSPDGSSFSIRNGKNENAIRFVPLVGDAQSLMRDRLSQHGSSGRVFPDWPIRPSTGKVYALPQWFTRFRRQVLGAETDGRLSLHSTRHTWRTEARRARVAEPDINELGGWAGQRSSNSVYDHGLLQAQLVDVQVAIWEQMQSSGYLDSF